MSKKKFRGEILGGSTKGACDAVGMVRNEKKGKFKKKKFRGDFLGGSYTGGRVWGECWEIRQDRGKKNFRGPEILGGTFGGNAKKRWKHFFGGSVGGAVNPNKF